MAKTVVNETKVEDLKEETTTAATEPATTETIVEEDSKLKKVIKWTLKGLALVATGVAGFFIGRATRGDNDDDTDDAEEKIEE